MTKSTSKKVRCISCGEDYHAKRGHICDFSKVHTGRSQSEPQHFKSHKLFYGKGGRK